MISISFLLTALLILPLAYFLYVYRTKSAKSLQRYHKSSPPGPFQLPFIGNLHLLAGRCPPYLKLKKLTDKYGSVVQLRLGQMNVVVIDDLELTKELFDREDWQDHYYHPWVGEARSFGKELGILFANGECWKEMRKFLIRTLSEFGFGKQLSMEAAIIAELEDFLIVGLRGRLKKDNIICMKKFFNISILNILWSICMGQRFSHDDKRLTNLLLIIDQIIKESAIGSMFIMAFPYLRHIFPKLSGIESQTRNHAYLQQFFIEALEEKKKLGSYKDSQNDLMDVFMSEIDRHSQMNLPGGSQYTEEQLIVTIMDLFMAGSDSTSSTLEFAILFLIQNPVVQEKIQAQLDDVIGRERLPNLSDRLNLPYLEAFILETQRKGSLLPIMMRTPTRDTIVGDFFVKKETVGFFNIHAIHHDPKIWESPHEFRPERFLTTDQSKIVHSDKILPLGYGKRKCLGAKLVEANLFMFLSTFLHQYHLKPSPLHHPPQFEPQMGHVLSSKEFHVQITLR